MSNEETHYLVHIVFITWNKNHDLHTNSGRISVDKFVIKYKAEFSFFLFVNTMTIQCIMSKLTLQFLRKKVKNDKQQRGHAVHP